MSAATDHPADIYAVGVVFYEILTGERPQQDLVPPSRKVEVDVRIDEIVLRDLDVDRAYAMWAAEGEMDDRRREQMLRDAQELRTAYAQDPGKLGTITEWYREGVYAVARMAAPVGGDGMHSVFVILVAKPEGWKVVDGNDIRGEATLKSKLDRLLGRN